MISEKGFVLENGTELPFLGFGTWLVKEEKIILDALASGYRHIDTARRYENEKMSATPYSSAVSPAESCS